MSDADENSSSRNETLVYQRAYGTGLLEFSNVKSPEASLEIWTPP